MKIKQQLRDTLEEKEFRVVYPTLSKIPDVKMIKTTESTAGENFLRQFRNQTVFPTFTCLFSGGQVNLGVDIKIPLYNTSCILASGYSLEENKQMNILLIVKGEKMNE